jgi:uncharacterized protein
MIIRKQKTLNLCVVTILCLLCLLKLSGLTILIAIPYLFIERKINKFSMETIGFKFRNLLSDVKKYWWLILLPVVSGILSIVLSKVIVPDFYLHVLERVRPMLSLDKVFLLIIQLTILAFAEEVVFRAFLQSKISSLTNPIIAIIITSLFFSIGHYSTGTTLVVLYDLIFIFIDSLMYGLIFERTKNVYACWISHFIANFVAIFLLLFI